MNRSKTNNHGLPKPDSRGRYRPYVGCLPDGSKARFTVGDRRASLVEMEKRLNLIRNLYERQCQRFKRDFWQNWTRQVALKLAAGQPVIDQCIGDGPRYTVAVVEQLRAWGIPVEVTKPDVYAEGLAIHREQVESVVQKLVAEEFAKQRELRGPAADAAVLPQDPLLMTETSTLHQTLEAYRKYLTDTGKKDQHGALVTRVRKCRDRIRYLKEHHDDTPLWKLDLPRIAEMAAYWRNRPKTKKRARCSLDHSRDMLKEFWRFLNWLDEHPNYRWEKPRSMDKISRSPVELPDDDPQGAFQTTTKETYTPEQLAIIARNTDDFGRAIIGVCVNCAFGASEIGQWPITRYSIHKPHPYAAKLAIETSAADSWIVGPRPKTGVYGEHLLWPQVGRAVNQFLDGRPVLPFGKTGNPWYRTHSDNPQTKFNNWWCKLLKKVRAKHPDVPYLPFGSLRDVLPDILRARYSDEIASMSLQHGETGNDDLLKCYANTPFAKLFRATREIEQHFKPFLEALMAPTDQPHPN